MRLNHSALDEVGCPQGVILIQPLPVSLRLIAIIVLCASAILLPLNSAFGQAVTILHRFSNVPVNPTGLILASDGNFYGTSSEEDRSNRGTIFKLTPDGVETTLYSFGRRLGLVGFHETVLDGSDPMVAPIEGSDGNFYGTTYNGGTYDQGTVFKITPSGELTTLYSFGAVSQDGMHPYATLILDATGNLYGTTSKGGVKRAGTVFKITPSGTEEILHSFGTVPHDGSTPFTPLVRGSDGALYGTTSAGGRHGKGAMYKISPQGVESVLYSFGRKPRDGAFPGAPSLEAMKPSLALPHSMVLLDVELFSRSLPREYRAEFINGGEVAHLAMKINGGSGLFSGTFLHPVTGQRTKLQGTLFYKQKKGGGFFLGGAQSGSVMLEAIK